MSRKRYLIVVDFLPVSILRSVKRLIQDPTWSSLELIVLTSNPDKANTSITSFKPSFKVNVWSCDFNSDAQLKSLINPISQDVVGVLCRGDKQVQYLRKIIPFLPANVKIASTEALKTATNKHLMREAFLKHQPTITPRFVEVVDSHNATLDHIEDYVKFPVIIKPASLASSLLIQACNNRVELKHELDYVLDRIRDIYKREDRQDPPEVIVEQYLDGELYSIDAYVLADGEVYCCPPIPMLPAKKLGVDDFFIFKRWAPNELSSAEIEAANTAVKLAIKAYGLTYSAAQADIILTSEGWKIIEVGPRLGRFRDKMYGLAYGIDHSFNDLSVHLGLKPTVNTKLVNYCAAYSIYPHKEGLLKEIKGLKTILEHPACKWSKVYLQSNESVAFAKHGGHSIAEFILASPSEQEFQDITTYADQQVYAEVQ